ncbi:unnamed protein product [Acanthoscelides obtectus]|uniref:Uncharacterized protein n=1 Tax=Acanthoscelides obtectus TaxID=200917 RepID=A0A9P0PDK5_ACAOB|nr:unnamed protein product [Acanthoscelides obtectus]CAK1631968.1 hypothetical protein AOBTE_LOCUS7264 [Acanthoscelides obtectus]
MVRRTTIFGNVKAVLFCSASARRPVIFLLFCLGHLRWIVEENFIDNFLGHSCCECVASFFFRSFRQTEPREKPYPTSSRVFILGESSLLEIY